MDDEGKIRKKILIAEDDPVSRHMLMAFLVKWDYEVVAAADGIEALRILESEGAPPLAVLDWMMPGLEGPQVCQRVREQSGRPYVYVLLLTARSQKGDLLRGLESGADDYLTKPFDAQELRARLRVGQRILDLQDSLIAAREELRFSATHDALTGISNRASIFEAVSREQSRQAREGGSFGVIFADIDHFKMINDRHGHHSGDVVLREVTQRMMGCSRPYDTLGRYGGEEFLIVLPGSDGLGALTVAERIRESFAKRPVHTSAGPVPLTLSLGVAAEGGEAVTDAAALLQAADSALKRAQQNGRNRAALADESGMAIDVGPSEEPEK